ncbi:hypothetical protein FQN53_006449 [Emmonsiellopsis sp. PD_33]|nr:hypothetical protein FQN53_006449 [Emmonsiellopsis sp. PD_33]
MPITRSLLNREITYSEAKEVETENILQELTYVTLAASFRDHFANTNSATIKAIVAHHLYLAPASCRIDISDHTEWTNGSFNLCVPISVRTQNQNARRRFLMQFPLPYKVAWPANGDEKIDVKLPLMLGLTGSAPASQRLASMALVYRQVRG